MENNCIGQRVYAGFFTRFMAYLIDTVIAGIAVGILTIPLRILSGFVDFLNAGFLFRFTIIDVISYVGVAAYFVLLTYFAHTTVGKMLFRLEVITEDGTWNIINVIYRETVGRFLSAICLIGYFAVIVTKRKQGFHDMLCDTFVVYKGMVAEHENVPMPKPLENIPPLQDERKEPESRQEPVAPVNEGIEEVPTYH